MSQTVSNSYSATTSETEVSESCLILIELFENQPDRWWSDYELKIAISREKSDSAVNLALKEMLSNNTIEADGYKVRLK